MRGAAAQYVSEQIGYKQLGEPPGVTVFQGGGAS
jgi:hypothetical protein